MRINVSCGVPKIVAKQNYLTMCEPSVMNRIHKSFPLKRVAIVIASVDFICTLIFGICTPFIYKDTLGISWCIVILCSDVCLLYGVKYTNYKCVVVWLTLFAINITFLLLLLPIIPMMIIAIYLGDKAIEKCYSNEHGIENNDTITEWMFQSVQGTQLDCNQAKDFFLGLKGIMYVIMTMLVLIPTYYILAWIAVNKFRSTFATTRNGYQRIE